MKPTLKDLDTGQLELMWQCLQMKPVCDCDKEDVETLEFYLDRIRQALIQKTVGQRKEDPQGYVDFCDVGTYVNLAILAAMTLHINGGLRRLKEALGNEVSA